MAGPTVGICAKPNPQMALPVLRRLRDWLTSEGLPFHLDPTAAAMLPGEGVSVVEREEMPERCDLLVVLGGDGTLLSAARHLHRREIPVLGVNLGRLGFLTEVSVDEMIPVLRQHLSGGSVVQHRTMFVVTLFRQDCPLATYHCLNDAVVNKAALARIIHLRVKVGGRWLTDMRADGLIVATPTGSTAYSLAAGGPILTPDLDVLLLAPLCPHTLTMRPIILRGDEPVSIDLMEDGGGVHLTADGQVGQSMEAGDRVEVRRSPHRVPLIQGPHRDYFTLLREKLGWGVR